MAIILFYTPIMNGDELQLLGMARRNLDTDLHSGDPASQGMNAPSKGYDIDIVVVREENHKVEDAIN